MRRLDRRFELKATDATRLPGGDQKPVRLLDHGLRPKRYILLRKRHVAAGRRAARTAPCLAIEHERQQALRFRLGGHEPQQQTAKVYRFHGQSFAARIGPRDIVRTAAISSIDRLQHGIQTRRQLLRLGKFEPNAGVADFRLRAGEPLAHRRGPREERGGDARRVEAQHGLQHERRARGGGDRRMRADEHEFQPFVGKYHAAGKLLCLLGRRAQRWRGVRVHADMTGIVDQPPPRHGQQPRLGLLRHAALRPGFERGFKCVGERLLRRRHIVRARGEKGDEAAIGVTRRLFDRAARVHCERPARQGICRGGEFDDCPGASSSCRPSGVRSRKLYVLRSKSRPRWYTEYV